MSNETQTAPVDETQTAPVDCKQTYTVNTGRLVIRIAWNDSIITQYEHLEYIGKFEHPVRAFLSGLTLFGDWDGKPTRTKQDRQRTLIPWPAYVETCADSLRLTHTVFCDCVSILEPFLLRLRDLHYTPSQTEVKRAADF